MSQLPSSSGAAWFDGRYARGLLEATSDPDRLENGGWWAVVVTFEGEYRLWRFESVDDAPLPAAPSHQAPGARQWTSSLDQAAYEDGVREIRRRIYEGDVYQVNLCRVLETEARNTEPWALAARLAQENPAPCSGVIDVPETGGVPRTRVVSASPELFLGRLGDRIRSSPIKGTGATAEDLLPKDEAENIMIVDLVRNDLQRVSVAGSVEVADLLTVEQHPGLVHLVSTVEARLAEGTTWRQLFEATLPPGSVSGAPKSSALSTIRDLEPLTRGPYCGAVGYIDADRAVARLAVGIRTFWWQGEMLRFGTGAGITADSEPAREWAETELKAQRLIGLADSQVSRRVTAASRSR